MYFSKMINIFHKDHLRKPTATFLFIDFTLPMIKLLAKLFIKNLKQKQGQLVKTPTK